MNLKAACKPLSFKLMRNKAIIIDLDGTAVDSPSQKLPSERLISAVAALQSQYFVVSATGRVWSFAKPILAALELTDPCIISGGAQICHPQTGEILWQENLSEKALKQAIEIFQQYPDYKVIYNDVTEDDYFHGGVAPQDFTHSEPVYFLEQKFVPDKIATEIFAKIKQIPHATTLMVHAQKPGRRDLHVISQKASKEHAIAELLQMIGVDRLNTIGIGDGHNDLHLFNGVAHKVAMGNAVSDLKAEADEVLGDVAEDGLAVYFEKLYRGK